MDILKLISRFESADDRETSTAILRTRVPWVGPAAYLHVIFKPLPNDLVSGAAIKLKIPAPVIALFRRQNGTILFSGALSIYGIHRPGQLLNREDPDFVLPFNIEEENSNWPPHDRTRFLAFGGYGFDGSTVCIDRIDFNVYLFQRGKQTLLQVPSFRWHNVEDWLVSELARLEALFDNRGKRLVEEAYTVPAVGPLS